MKLFLSLCLFSFIVVTLCDEDHNRGCFRIMGTCREECPVGTHEYSSACGVLHPEPTCENPNPQPESEASVCDYSACYCDAPTVKDKRLNKCVRLEECSTA